MRHSPTPSTLPALPPPPQSVPCSLIDWMWPGVAPFSPLPVPLNLPQPRPSSSSQQRRRSTLFLLPGPFPPAATLAPMYCRFSRGSRENVSARMTGEIKMERPTVPVSGVVKHSYHTQAICLSCFGESESQRRCPEAFELTKREVRQVTA